MADGANKNVTLASVRSGQKKLQRDDVTKSDDIKQLQRAIYMAGFWSSPNEPDGVYGIYTECAVRGFQYEKGLQTSGVVDKATLSKLEAWSGTLSATRSKSPALTYIRRGTQYAVSGDIGAAPAQIRGLLIKKGYNCASTGPFNAELVGVVKKFQKDSGLTQDGSVGQVTLAVLENTVSDTGWLSNGTVRLTAGLLARCGFKQALLCSEFVSKLNSFFNKYEINTKPKVRHVLAQILAETQYGTRLMEGGYRAGAKVKWAGAKDYFPYYGGGFIHVTFDYAYRDFSAYINDPKAFTPEEYATQHVAYTHPGTSAGWFLTVLKKSQWDRISWSAGEEKVCKDVTDVVRGVGQPYKQRYEFYKKIATILK